MRTIFVLFDSLNRRSLAPYGGTAIKTPQFTRLAQRCVTFDNHYVGSLPCMPARRDMHTGRLNFLHRGWGPLADTWFLVPDSWKSGIRWQESGIRCQKSSVDTYVCMYIHTI